MLDIHINDVRLDDDDYGFWLVFGCEIKDHDNNKTICQAKDIYGYNLTYEADDFSDPKYLHRYLDELLHAAKVATANTLSTEQLNDPSQFQQWLINYFENQLSQTDLYAYLVAQCCEDED